MLPLSPHQGWSGESDLRELWLLRVEKSPSILQPPDLLPLPRLTHAVPPLPASSAPPLALPCSLHRPPPRAGKRRRRGPSPRSGARHPPSAAAELPFLAPAALPTRDSPEEAVRLVRADAAADPWTVRFLPIQISTGPCQTPKQTRLCSSLGSLLEFLFTPAFSSRVHECSRLSLPHYDDWVTADAAPRQVPRSSSRPSPATSTNPVCPPLICPSCRAKSITQTLTYAIWLFVFGSGLFTSIYTCIMPINSIFSFCKNYILGYTYVHSCPLLAPALICSDRGLLFSINRY